MTLFVVANVPIILPAMLEMIIYMEVKEMMFYLLLVGMMY